jgi:hypothetical protein
MEPLLLFSFCCLLYVLQQVSFLPVSVNFTPLFFFRYTYGETVLIFAEPGLEVLA